MILLLSALGQFKLSADPHSHALLSLDGLNFEVCANKAEDHAFEILHSQ